MAMRNTASPSSSRSPRVSAWMYTDSWCATGTEGMVAGEIGAALDVPPTNLSFHLKALTQAGLLTVVQEGRYQRYRANLPLMQELIAYLTAECCAGHPELCAHLRCFPAIGVRDRRGSPDRPCPEAMNVLFLCTGNSCRSILAEATFNHLAPAGWKAMSAGSKPTGHVHPRVAGAAGRRRDSDRGLHSKSWDNLPATPDIVVTVCASAAGETCPAYLGPVLRTHWGVDDPAHATGTDAEIDAAFRQAYRILRTRIEAFLALPLHELAHDRAG